MQSKQDRRIYPTVFGTSRRIVAGHEAIVLSSAAGSELIVIPSLGGMVHALSLDSLPDLLRSDEEDELVQNPLFRGRLLFPFNDRIPLGRYSFDGSEYQLPVNDPVDGSAIHGFLYRREMKIIESMACDNYASLTLGLDLSDDEEQGYPFCLSLRVEYRLDLEGFHLRMTAKNTGSRAAPLAFGWHPYFRLAGGNADAWTLRHDARAYAPVGSDLLPTGGLSSVANTPFDFTQGRLLADSQLDIALVASREIASLSSETASIYLSADMPPFAYTQLFIPSQRDCVAIEPITGVTDSFNRPGLGCLRLEPGETVSGTIYVQATRT